MYSFGKEIRDLKEAEKIAVELVENGSFDTFIEKTGINKDVLIEKIEVAECFTLGIDYDIVLEDLFDVNSQKAIIDEIKQRESNSSNSLIVGDGSIYLEDIEDTIYVYFLASEVYSKTNTDKMLLLSIGCALGDDIVEATKQFVIL